MAQEQTTGAAAGQGDGPPVQSGNLAALALARAGVDVAFTLSGAHLFPFYDGCVRHGVRLVDVRHEQSAVFAAEAVAKVTRRAGVAALTAGPGVTNGISAITTAWFTGSPILVLGGRAPDQRWGQGSLQEIDHLPIVRTITKHAVTVRATEDVAAEVDRALCRAQEAHRGPVYLDIPLDVIFRPTAARVDAPGRPAPTPPPLPADLAAIGALLQQAERPVLLVGADAYWERAEGALARCAEEVGLPVLMNGLGRGLLPADHPQAMSRCRQAALRGADLVIVVGTPLDFRLGFGRFGDARVVHVMDREDGPARHVALAASAAGDLGAAFDGVRAAALAGRRPQNQEWLGALRREEAAKRWAEQEALGDQRDPIRPSRIYGELGRRLARDTIVIGDGGDFVSYAGKYVDTYVPGSFLDPGPYGCLGTGFGYALGAQIAQPGRRVVLLLGDGAAGFALGDFDTLVRHGLPVVVIIGNNLGWGLEKHPMRQLYGYHVVAELAPTARYDLVASALGGAGRQVTRAAELGPALDWAFDQKAPVVLNVMTDPEDVYPRSSVLA